jgi:hypothetical protein
MEMKENGHDAQLEDKLSSGLERSRGGDPSWKIGSSC